MSTTARTINVVVVDDQESVRSAAAELLGDAPDVAVVGQASDGAEGVELVAQVEPAVVLMDMRMPVLDGVEATRQIIERNLDTAVLIHSAYGDESLVLEAFQAGARGYVLKGSSGSDLVAAVRHVAMGQAHVSDEITRPLITKLTQALEAERRTRIAAEEAAALSARLQAQQQEFAIQASHELRTPLSVLMGSLEMLSDDGELTREENGSLAKGALEGARRILSITEDLEVIASGELIGIAVQPVDVRMAVDEVVTAMGSTAHEVRFAFDGLRVMADPQRLRQVLGHLVRNAAEASGADGVVVLEARSADGRAQIDVIDSGAGIDQEVMGALFEPFAHKNGSASGLGVGLAVVRVLVRLMGGEVTARNNEGQGATVTVALPVAGQ